MFWSFLFLCSLGYADMFAYPPQKLSASGVHALKISGVKGKLTLKGRRSDTYTVKVSHSKNKRFEDWNLSVDRQGDTLVLEVFNVALGAQWKKSVREENYPEFDVEFEGPPVGAVVSWREGRLEVDNWSANLEASYLKGLIAVAKGKGHLKIQAVEGQLKVSGFDGSLHVKGEKGRVELSEVKGSVELNWLQGILRGERLSGNLMFDLASGEARLSAVDGKLKVTGQSSAWDVRARAPADVEVVTESGPVKIGWRGGAKLFLTSQSGAIRPPPRHRVQTRDGLKVVETTLEKPPRGQVFVRTQSGAITWQ